jgi:hypothetical protein
LIATSFHLRVSIGTAWQAMRRLGVGTAPCRTGGVGDRGRNGVLLLTVFWIPH